jgi:hypothetical protein
MPRKKKPTSPPKPAAPRFPMTAECYGDPSWLLGYHTDTKPSAVNSIKIDRYRITIEKIDEPPDVLLARMLVLWRTGERNTHRWHPFWTKAMELGLTEEAAREMFDPRDHGADRKSTP